MECSGFTRATNGYCKPVRYSPAADKWPSTPDRLSHTNRLSPHFQVVRDAPGLEVKLQQGSFVVRWNAMGA